MPYLAPRLLALFLLLASVQVNAQSAPFASWMSDNWEVVKDKPIRELVIPGSHDAGTYRLGTDGTIVSKVLAEDDIKQNCSIFGVDASICLGYARTQVLDIYSQLSAGARFFDLRFARTYEPLNPSLGDNIFARYSFRIHHSFLGPTKEEVFTDIRRFLAEPGHENEIILLQFNQMVGWDKGKPKTNSFTRAEHREFLLELGVRFPTANGDRTIADFMVPASIQVPVAGTVDEVETIRLEQMTPQQVVGGYQVGNRFVPPTGQQVIVYYPTNDDGHKQQDVYGSTTNKLWEGKPLGEFMGSILTRECKLAGTEDCSGLFYPNPSRWQSEDSIANDWLFRLPGRSLARNPNDEKICRSCEEAWVTNVSFGADKGFTIFTNTLRPDPDIIGWSNLADAAAFYNPRLTPHLINRPRKDVNILTTDFYTASHTLEAIKLNKNPARVTLNIKSVELKDDSCNQGIESFDTDCDFYPVFKINNDESEAPVSTILGPQHQRGRVIDDDSFVARRANWQEPFWTHTVAVAWDQPLFYSIDIIDDDPSPLSDSLVGVVNTAFLSSPISPSETLGQILQGQDGCYPDITDEFSDVRVVYDLFIENWDTPNGGCGPAWSVSDVIVSADPNQLYADNVSFIAELNPARTGISVVRGIECNDADVCGLEPRSMCAVVGPTPTGRSLGRVESGENRFHQGTTTVRCEAMITDGTRSAATFTVTVLDSQPPVISVPADIAGYEATGTFTLIDIGVATANDALDGDVNVANNAPASYPLGATVVTWSATDSAGNTATADQTITVVDSQPPTIMLPADIAGFEATGALTTVDIGLATAMDPVDGQVNVANNAPASYPVGRTIVNWTSTDAAGNTATAEQSVTVVDTIAPVVTAPEPTSVSTGVEGENIGMATASDAVGVRLISKDAPNMFSEGQTVVSWYAIDEAGNIGEATQVVTGEKSGGGGAMNVFTLLSLLIALLFSRLISRRTESAL